MLCFGCCFCGVGNFRKLIENIFRMQMASNRKNSILDDQKCPTLGHSFSNENEKA
jgi:hypothetical protein